jgi:NAD(P)-dependent dehydrogenase (short-subunit alcohol dehydrogenase family)
MSRIFITGSTDGLGRAAARALLNDGHQVVLHARSQDRTLAFGDLASRSAGVVVGDLSSGVETRCIAEQVNAIGRMDAIIHNAGTYSTTGRSTTPEGHAAILAVNTLAPYMLTAIIQRPDRLIYLSSGMHRGGASSLRPRHQYWQRRSNGQHVPTLVRLNLKAQIGAHTRLAQRLRA